MTRRWDDPDADPMADFAEARDAARGRGMASPVPSVPTEVLWQVHHRTLRRVRVHLVLAAVCILGAAVTDVALWRAAAVAVLLAATAGLCGAGAIRREIRRRG